jgi:hypothetical protein
MDHHGYQATRASPCLCPAVGIPTQQPPPPRPLTHSRSNPGLLLPLVCNTAGPVLGDYVPLSTAGLPTWGSDGAHHAL